MALDLAPLQQIARQERDLEEQRSNFQAEGNRIGKAVGQLIQGGSAPNSPEVQALRDQGNAIKQQVAALEEQEKALELQLREALSALPNPVLYTHLTLPTNRELSIHGDPVARNK